MSYRITFTQGIPKTVYTVLKEMKIRYNNSQTQKTDIIIKEDEEKTNELIESLKQEEIAFTVSKNCGYNTAHDDEQTRLLKEVRKETTSQERRVEICNILIKRYGITGLDGLIKDGEVCIENNLSEGLGATSREQVNLSGNASKPCSSIKKQAEKKGIKFPNRKSPEKYFHKEVEARKPIMEKLIAAGKTTQEIADEMKLTYNTVWLTIKRLGLPQPKKEHYDGAIEDSRKQIEELIKQKKSYKEIAIILGMKPATVWNRIKTLGLLHLTKRERDGSVKESNPTKKQRVSKGYNWNKNQKSNEEIERLVKEGKTNCEIAKITGLAYNTLWYRIKELGLTREDNSGGKEARKKILLQSLAKSVKVKKESLEEDIDKLPKAKEFNLDNYVRVVSGDWKGKVGIISQVTATNQRPVAFLIKVNGMEDLILCSPQELEPIKDLELEKKEVKKPFIPLEIFDGKGCERSCENCGNAVICYVKQEIEKINKPEKLSLIARCGRWTNE